jgi:urease accessory protein
MLHTGFGHRIMHHRDSTSANMWLCWQLLDSAFPSGGFTQSGGLEALHAHGMAAGELKAVLAQGLMQTCYSVAPFASAAYDAIDDFMFIDSQTDAFLTSDVACRASRRQGQALLRSAVPIFGLEGLAEIATQVRDEVTPGHLAPIFGRVCAELTLSRDDMHHLLMFTNLRALVSAATRLNIVGPLQAQTLQRELADEAIQWVELARSLTLDDAAQTSPLLELMQGTHDRLYSRLFQS